MKKVMKKTMRAGCVFALLACCFLLVAECRVFGLAPRNFSQAADRYLVRRLVDSVEDYIEKIRSGDVVYFIAPGNGKYVKETLRRIGDKKIKVVLVDISDEMLGKCRENLSGEKGIQFEDIHYLHEDVHNIELVFTRFQAPNFIFVFDALHNIREPNTVLELLISILDEERGYLAGNFPDEYLSQPKVFQKVVRVLHETQLYYKQANPETAFYNSSARYYSVSTEKLPDEIQGSWQIGDETIRISQTIADFLWMLSEEQEYLERFFRGVFPEFARSVLAEAIKNLQNRNTLIDRGLTFVPDNPLNLMMVRNWRVLKFERRFPLEQIRALIFLTRLTSASRRFHRMAA